MDKILVPELDVLASLDADDLDLDDGPAPAVPLDTEARSVLVVEDDPDTAARCLKTLRRMGFRPVVAPSGREALELLDRDGASYALACVDLGLRDVGGRAVAAHARHRRPGLPVVLVTEDLLEVLTAPGVALCRPFTADEFERAFDAALLFEEPPADEPTWFHGSQAVWEDEGLDVRRTA